MKKRQRNTFLTPLVVEVMPSGKTFKVAREFTHRWRFRDKGFDCEAMIHVPVGFITDFASIPRFARIIIPKLGRWTKASVVHDYLYQNAIPSLTRVQVDRCFRNGMRDLGVVKWKRIVMWLAVRIFGGFAWRKR